MYLKTMWNAGLPYCRLPMKPLSQWSVWIGPQELFSAQPEQWSCDWVNKANWRSKKAYKLTQNNNVCCLWVSMYKNKGRVRRKNINSMILLPLGKEGSKQDQRREQRAFNSPSFLFISWHKNPKPIWQNYSIWWLQGMCFINLYIFLY